MKRTGGAVNPYEIDIADSGHVCQFDADDPWPGVTAGNLSLTMEVA